MTKIFADITVEDDQGEITKYRAAVLGLERIEFVLGQRSEFLLEPPKLTLGDYFDMRGVGVSGVSGLGAAATAFWACVVWGFVWATATAPKFLARAAAATAALLTSKCPASLRDLNSLPAFSPHL